MQQFIIIPELYGIVRKEAPQGMNYVGFGVSDAALLESYLGAILRLGEGRYYWTTHPQVPYVEEACNSSF